MILVYLGCLKPTACEDGQEGHQAHQRCALFYYTCGSLTGMRQNASARCQEQGVIDGNIIIPGSSVAPTPRRVRRWPSSRRSVPAQGTRRTLTRTTAILRRRKPTPIATTRAPRSRQRRSVRGARRRALPRARAPRRKLAGRGRGRPRARSAVRRRLMRTARRMLVQ